MSYDIKLYRKGIVDKEQNIYYEYEDNITYTVKTMLENAFGEAHLKKWNNRPASYFLDSLSKGIIDMKKRPRYYKQFNSPDNAWGNYETTLEKLNKLECAILEYAEYDGYDNVFLEFIY